MSISKSQLKLITSLSQKKYRQKYNLFVAEGIKVVNELLNSSFDVEMIFCTNDFETRISKDKITRISETELKKISTLKSQTYYFGRKRSNKKTEFQMRVKVGFFLLFVVIFLFQILKCFG